MRISTAQFTQRAIDGISERSVSLAKLQQSIASGKRVNKASDDPMAAAEAERLRSSRAALEIEQRMMRYASGMLAQAESALSAGGDLLQDARDLLISAGNGSYGIDQRRIIATQIEGIREELLALANQRDGSGGYVFGGQGATSAPFDGSGSPVYTVNTGTRQTGMSLGFDTTIDGAAVFLGDGGPVLPETGSVFAALDTIVANLRDPALDGVALTDALKRAIDTTDQSIGRMLTARTDIGEQLRALDSRSRLIESGDLRLQSRISELVDTDYAAAISELQMNELAQTAAMQSYARIARLSLFDYL